MTVGKVTVSILSATVLMFRMYGIPARYAAGYAVSPSDFTENEDGWHAEVTDEAAHAWPEIFVENVGWIPVEATPSARGEMTVYPGMDEEVLRAELHVQTVVYIVSKAAFSREAVTEEERNVKKFCLIVTERVYGSLPRRKRILCQIRKLWDGNPI